MKEGIRIRPVTRSERVNIDLRKPKENPNGENERQSENKSEENGTQEKRLKPGSTFERKI